MKTPNRNLDRISAVSIPLALPESLQSIIDEYKWASASDGASGAAVYRLDAPGRPTMYLKHGTADQSDHLVGEMARLTWLAGRLPVPRVRNFVLVPGHAYLLTEEISGQNAYSFLKQQPENAVKIVTDLAGFLRGIHSLALADCPFRAGHEILMAEARRNIDLGLVDAGDFDDDRQGNSPEKVWAEMVGLLPLHFESVFTHGDFTLDNVLLSEGGVTGCIDVGGAGAADPYQDLAAMWSALAEFGSDLQRTFISSYGIQVPDARKLQFHLSLGEFL